jgi:nucleotide-binding universal stress UspA family protein
MQTADIAPVVVGVSGTAASLAAVRVAAVEAERRRVALRLIHAFSWPMYDTAGDSYAPVRHAADEMLDRAAVAARRTAPDVPVTGLVFDGAPSRVLLQQSRTAGLLVLGDDDPSATAYLPVDSVLLQLVARARCPVLVARAGGTPTGPIAVGVDGSPPSLLALRYAATEAERRAVPLDVVHVWEPQAGEDEATARTLLETALAAVPGGIKVNPLVVAGDPAQELLAATDGAALLAVGPRGAGGGFWTLLGAVGQAVLRHATCPTVFVHGATTTAADLLGPPMTRTPPQPA